MIKHDFLKMSLKKPSFYMSVHFHIILIQKNDFLSLPFYKKMSLHIIFKRLALII